jgi:hypothetical protein
VILKVLSVFFVRSTSPVEGVEAPVAVNVLVVKLLQIDGVKTQAGIVKVVVSVIKYVTSFYEEAEQSTVLVHFTVTVKLGSVG